MANVLERKVQEFAIERGYKPKRFGENPSVLILGESHGSIDTTEEQISVVSSIEPDYLLHEFLRNYIFDPKKRELKENPEYQQSPEIQEFLIKEFEKLPMQHGDYLGHLTRWSKEANISIKLHPCEIDYFCMDFEPSIQMHIDIGYNFLKSFVGCDLSYSEMLYWGDFFKVPDVYFNAPKVYKKRETRMGDVIVKYAKITEKSVVAVLGNYHVRPKSLIHSILRDENVGYIVIKQRD